MTYPTATADKVPMEISCDGFLRSPLIFIPAMTPVRAGKNTPKTLNQFCLSVYPGLLLFFHTVAFQPWNPFSKFQKWYSILLDTSIQHQKMIWLYNYLISLFLTRICVRERSNTKINGASQQNNEKCEL